MLTFHARKNSLLCHLYFTSLNAENKTLYQRLSHFVPRRSNNPAEGLA
jgi:hypothetical protein